MSILLICEKPQAAEKIAEILGGKKIPSISNRGVLYYEVQKDVDKIYVVPALGHLYNLKEKSPTLFRRYPVFAQGILS